MAKTKIEMILRIIDVLDINAREDLSPITELQIRNRLQLRLQKLHNNRLASILGNLEEDLICRYFMPGKGYCQNDSLDKKVYCALHVINGEGRR